MATDIRVPALGESVTEATVGQWFKQAGDAVTADEPLVELETDKVTVEVPAPASGVLSDIKVKTGETVAVGTLLGAIVAGDGKKPSKPDTAKAAPAEKGPVKKTAAAPSPPKPVLEKGAIASPEQPVRPRKEPPPLEREPSPREEFGAEDMPPSPSARKRLAEQGLSTEDVKGSGRRGQILKHDVPVDRRRREAARPSPPPAARPRAPRARGARR